LLALAEKLCTDVMSKKLKIIGGNDIIAEIHLQHSKQE